jgi:hypothetical protein
MALHPDIISANRIGHAAFLVFSSQAVRDKAYPAVEKAQLKNKPVQVDCCGSKSKKPKKSAKEPSKSLIFLKKNNAFSWIQYASIGHPGFAKENREGNA